MCDLTGQTHTERLAHKEMIGGCHVLITADLVEGMSWTGRVQMWDFSLGLVP